MKADYFCKRLGMSPCAARFHLNRVPSEGSNVRQRVPEYPDTVLRAVGLRVVAFGLMLPFLVN